MTDINRLYAIELAYRAHRHRAFRNLGNVYVPGEGGNAPIAFIIGEAPGAQEEIQRRPFVGPAGLTLRSLMDIAGLYASDNIQNAWLTNVVKYRPPGNRVPTEYEINASKAALRAEWQAVGSPRIIIPVGSTALTAVLGQRRSILQAAGKIIRNDKPGREPFRLYIWPMVHPAYGLRNPEAQPSMEQDWGILGAWLKHGISA
jgi:DNA polymerase